MNEKEEKELRETLKKNMKALKDGEKALEKAMKLLKIIEK